MLFAHDTELALLATVALVNSASEPDTLLAVEDVVAFYDEHGYTGRLDADAAELAAVQALRPRLRELVTSDRDDAVALVNDMLRRTRALPRLVRHASLDWHVHAVEDDQPLAVRIEVEAAMAMIDVIRGDEMSRLDVCADDDCDGVVLDLSRNRSKRFCSTTCSNRAAVAAYRARRAN